MQNLSTFYNIFVLFVNFSTLNRFKSWNPLPYIRSFFQTEIREEILGGVDIRLLYLNGELIHLQSKKSIENVSLDAESIANASQQILLNDSSFNKQNSKKTSNSIALFLPLTEFIYTQYSMPAIDSANIKAALEYQREELLPASHSDLQLAISHVKNTDNFALWFSGQKLQDYYLAFQQAGLSLTVVLPRFVLLANKGLATKGINLSLDKDDQHGTFREQADGYLAQYHFFENSLAGIGHITEQDEETEVFRQQWEKDFGLIEKNTACFKNKSDWFAWLKGKNIADHYKHSHYTFFPEPIKKNFKSRGRLRNSRVIGLIAFILLFTLAIPFIINEVRYWKYESKYQEFVVKAKDVMDLRSSVLNHEEEWEVYLNYPRIDAYDII